MRRPFDLRARLAASVVAALLTLAPVTAAAVGSAEAPSGDASAAIVEGVTTEDPVEGVADEDLVDGGSSDATPGDSLLADVPDDSGVTSESKPADGVPLVAPEPAPAEPASSPDLVPTADAPELTYAAHVSDVGWMESVPDGATAGTTGQARCVEALELSLSWPGHEGALEASAHVSDIGWMGWTSGVAGTTGQSKHMEAVRLRLTGELAERYDVWYRVHASNVGWLGWTSNGEIAGTTGLGWGMEAIEIRLVEKGGQGPAETSPNAAYVTMPTLSAHAHVSDVGWMAGVGMGSTLGTTGQNHAMEAYDLSVGAGVSGSIAYSAHVSNIGWTGESVDGAASGTTGRGLAIEAVKIRLTGTLGSLFDVWYRAHVANYGWLGWASNGAAAGTSGISYQLEALQVVIVPKGSPAPGSTSNAFTTTPVLPAYQAAMLNRANSYASATPWLILVDTTNCNLGIYTGSQGSWRQVANWVCSTGQPWTPTVVGQFTVTGKGYSFGHGYTCYYYTQFYGDYLIHSIKYYQGTFTVMDGRLGQHVSQGCVRLPINQAKWIYDNIPYGTKVVTYR